MSLTFNWYHDLCWSSLLKAGWIPPGKVTHLVNILSISPHVGGEAVKVKIAAEVFSSLPEAHDLARLAKISNMMNDCIIYSLINWACTWIRKPIKKIKETEYSTQKVDLMQKPTSEGKTCTCTVQPLHEWQFNVSGTEIWFMYTDALNITVQTKGLAHTESIVNIIAP